VQFDRHGWAMGTIAALPTTSAYTLFSAEGAARIDIAVFAHKARTFFASSFELEQPKAYPNDATPDADAVHVEIKRLGKQSASATRVLVVTWPIEREPGIRSIGDTAARAIGGAGMDALVARAKRIWQVSSEIVSGDDPNAPLRVAAIFASVLLAPIVPPEGNTIYGVKGARERLERM
jgi:hypothetical protein